MHMHQLHTWPHKDRQIRQAVTSRHTYLLDFLDLLVQPANHVVSAVWNLLHLHEAHQWVHLGGKQKVQGIAVVAQSNSCASGDLVDVYILVQIYYILSLWMYLDQDLVLAHDLHRQQSEVSDDSWRGLVCQVCVELIKACLLADSVP